MDVSRKWADEQDNEDYDKDLPITLNTERLSDGSIRKTIVEYKTNESGHKVKVVKKVRLYKAKVNVNRAVEQRKSWKKFGECQNGPSGPEKGITTVGEDVFLELTNRPEDDKQKKKKNEEVVNLDIQCRKCGNKGHWTLKCPFVGLETRLNVGSGGASSSSTTGSDSPRSISSSSSSSLGKYRPPIPRDRDFSSPNDTADGEFRRTQREEWTIRVTHLSEDTKEADLQDLFKPFGHVMRIFLAKGGDRNAKSKGFAFVTFSKREEAANAIQRLNGFGYDHLILHVEWAKPSSKN